MSEQTWREFLGKLIRNPAERQRIASAVEVKEVTLQRWASGRANPHPRNLHQLVETLPQFYELLVPLIQEEFPDFENATVSMRESIPTIMYSLVLDAYVNHVEALSKGTILSLVLLQLAPHIDPGGTNSFVSLAYCYPSMHSLVLSKTSYFHGRTQGDIYRHILLLGAESLASYVVGTCEPAIIQQTTQETIFPLSDAERQAQSIGIWPIQRHGRVAGACIVSSQQPYFFSGLRVKLIVEYVRLLTLAFREEEFLPCQNIRFHFMRSNQQSFIGRVRNSITSSLEERDIYEQLEAEIMEKRGNNEYHE